MRGRAGGVDDQVAQAGGRGAGEQESGAVGVTRLAASYGQLGGGVERAHRQQLRGQLAGQPAGEEGGDRRRTGRGAGARRWRSGRRSRAGDGGIPWSARLRRRHAPFGVRRVTPRKLERVPRSGLGSAHGPPQWTRRELPLPGDARAAAARLRRDRARPGDDPGRLLLRASSRTSSSAGSTASRCSTASSSRCRSASTTRSGSTTTTSTSTGTCTGWRCPSPGGERELADLCGHLAGIPLDRSRPLWEFVVIEGLESGKVAVFTKMHHCTVDGVSGANAISFLCSLEPDAPPLEPRAETAARPRDAGRRRAARARARHQPRPSRSTLAKLVAPTDRRASPRRSAAPASGTAMAAPLTRAAHVVQRHHHRPPHRRARRHVAGQDQGDQERRHGRHRQRRRAHRVRWRAASLPRRARRAARRARCSPRCRSRCAASRRSTSGSNKVSTIFSRLGTDIEDPLERLAQVSEGNTERQGPPQGDPGRHAAGLGRVRRPAHLRPRRPDGRPRCGSPTAAR